MRRLLVALAIVALMGNAAMAEGMMFGVKGGLNLANWSGDTEMLGYDNSMKMGFGGGVWMSYAITEAFAIQPEALFMIKGTKWDIEGIDLNANLAYIDFNILGKFVIPTESDFAPFIMAGPQIGLLLKSELEAMGMTEDMKDYTKSIDFGIAFGAGFDFMLGSGCVSFDARYVLGLTSIDDPGEGEAADLKNTGIMFMVGYGFAL